MKHDFWNKIKQNGYEVLEISFDLVESYNKWLSEEGEAPITVTAGVEPKDQPVIEGKKKKKKAKVKDNAKKWVRIGPVSRWGYGLYGVSPDGNESGDSGDGDSGGGGM